MIKKLLLSTMLILTLVIPTIAFTGCGGNDRLKISCTMFEANLIGKDAMWEYLEEKFNVDFQFISVTEDNFEEKNQTFVATNNMPDLMWLDLDESNFSTYANWANQGALSAMPSKTELQENYPNLYAQYNLPINVGDELMTISGTQYAHPCIRDNANNDFLSGMGWMYRRDWAKELNLYQQNDIYTWEQWVALCEAFMEEDPGNNGFKNIGMGTASYYFPMAFGVYQTSTEYGFGTYALDNSEYVWSASQPETLQGLQIAKDLYDKNLIWKDNHLGSSPDSYYTSGLMGMIFQNFTLGRYNSFLNTVKTTMPNANAEDVCALAKVVGPDGTYWAKQSQCYYGAVVMSANINPQVKETWLSILDWLVSDEGSLFIQYGIPDKDYEIDQYGNAICLWPTSPTDPSVKVDPYPSGARLFYECYVGAVDTEVAPSVIYPQNVIETINNQYSFMKEKAYIRKFDYESSYLSAPQKNTLATLQMLTEEKMMQLIVTGTKENLANDWNAWINSKSASVALVLNELNTTITNKPVESPKKLA